MWACRCGTANWDDACALQVHQCEGATGERWMYDPIKMQFRPQANQSLCLHMKDEAHIAMRPCGGSDVTRWYGEGQGEGA